MPLRIPARKSGIASRHTAVLLDAMADGQDLLVPLTLRHDLPVRPAVAPGDRVEPGQALSQPADDRGICAFSGTSAVVTAIETVDTEYACELPAVRLRLGPPDPTPASMPAAARHQMADWTLAAAGNTPTTGAAAGPAGTSQGLHSVLADMARIEDLPATLDELGVLATYAGRPEPMGNLLRRASGQTKLLVVNALQSEPRLASHVRLTLDAAEAIGAGAKAVCAYLGLRRCTLLISAAHRMHPGLVRKMRRFGIRVLPVRTTFPGGEDLIVLRRLFGRSISGAGDGLDAGGLVLPADAAWRAGLALIHQKPVPLQPVTVAGDCLVPASQQVYLLPIGLTIHGLIQCLARRNLLPPEPKVVLLGGPMTGASVVDTRRTVITQATQAVLLMGHKPRLHTTGCIRCGWCIDGCPVGIDPIAILDALEAGRFLALRRLAAERCINCGVCSCVCPSHLPLAQAARTARALPPTDHDPRRV